MQGYWKNKVGGWNHKDTKRKKQTRNHFFKDNGRQLLKTYDYDKGNVDESKYRNETVMVHTYTGSRYGDNTPLEKTVSVYKVRIYYPNTNVTDFYRYSWYDEENTDKVSIKAYQKGNKWNKHWYEDETHKPIREFLGLSLNQYWKCEVFEVRKLGEIDLDWSEEIDRRNRTHVFSHEEGTTFLYGKPLPDWKRWTLYNDGKRRVFVQKHANRTTRAKMREWIQKGDWDTVPKNHALEKSIAWEVS